MCLQCLAVTHSTTNFCVPKMSVVFNTPYLVKILSPGSPSRFWLNLESTSIEKIEKELEISYRNYSQLNTLPRPGSFVVCLHLQKYCRGKVVRYTIFNILKNVNKNLLLSLDHHKGVLHSNF